MSLPSLVLLILLLTLGTFSVLFMRAAVPAPGSSTRRGTARPSATRARPPAPRSAPSPVEWNRSAANAAGPEAERKEIRDRYVSARFRGLFTSADQFQDVRRVIKAARLCYEDGRLDRAQELLAIAIQHSPEQSDLRLAQIELAFLARDDGLFTELAQAYRSYDVTAEDWTEIRRMGRALAPAQAIFNDDPGLPASKGAPKWPDSPNWMQASWDLTPDVLASQFHRALNARSPS